jgi:hypothetical protein
MDQQGNGGQVGGQGSDHGKVVVFYNADRTRFVLDQGAYTVEQLKDQFGVQPGYVLELFEHGEFVEFASPLQLKDGMHFSSFVATGHSS